MYCFPRPLSPLTSPSSTAASLPSGHWGGHVGPHSGIPAAAVRSALDTRARYLNGHRPAAGNGGRAKTPQKRRLRLCRRQCRSSLPSHSDAAVLDCHWIHAASDLTFASWLSREVDRDRSPTKALQASRHPIRSKQARMPFKCTKILSPPIMVVDTCQRLWDAPHT